VDFFSFAGLAVMAALAPGGGIFVPDIAGIKALELETISEVKSDEAFVV
jgi:hypothetical protein